MFGIGKMLSGKGEAENRRRHNAFRDAIPQNFPAGMSEPERARLHPAYSGPKAKTKMAADYRRAHAMHGPQSQAEHRAFERQQNMMDEYERREKASKTSRVLSFGEWLIGLF